MQISLLGYSVIFKEKSLNSGMGVITTSSEGGYMKTNISEMTSYGYTWDGMLPLAKSTALWLFDNDMPVYLLYQDNSECIAENKIQIEEHEGIFGIEKNFF